MEKIIGKLGRIVESKEDRREGDQQKLSTRQFKVISDTINKERGMTIETFRKLFDTLGGDENTSSKIKELEKKEVGEE